VSLTTCRACGREFERRDIRCPDCGTVTRPEIEDERSVCTVCRIAAAGSVLLLLIWIFVFLIQVL
jgi:threonine synthase